ncbi:hypothetical protein RUND412_007296 [Rhizina undulata]
MNVHDRNYHTVNKEKKDKMDISPFLHSLSLDNQVAHLPAMLNAQKLLEKKAMKAKHTFREAQRDYIMAKRNRATIRNNHKRLQALCSFIIDEGRKGRGGGLELGSVDDVAVVLEKLEAELEDIETDLNIVEEEYRASGMVAADLERNAVMLRHLIQRVTGFIEEREEDFFQNWNLAKA